MTRFLLLLLLYSSLLYSQEELKIDSLHKLYEKHKNSDLQKAEACATKALLLNNEGLKTLISYSNYIEVLYKQRKDSLATTYITELTDLANTLNNKKFLCVSYLHLSNNNRRKRNYDESLKNIEKALVLAKNNNLTDLEHTVLNSKVFLLNNTKNNDKAFLLLKNILKNKTFKNATNLGYTYNSLATSYCDFLKKKDSSAYFYKKGINTIQHTDNDYLKTILYLNLGDVLLQAKDSEQGVRYLLLAKEIATKCNNFKALYSVTSSLAIYYHSNKEYPKAIKKYEEAEQKYGKYTDKRSIAHLYWLLSEAYYLNKQHKEGYLCQEKFINLKDSLFTIEKNKTFEKLQTEYEVEKKNNQIQLLEKEKELEANRKKLVFGIGGLLLFLLGLLVFVFRYKATSQKLIRNQEQQLYLQEKAQLEQAQKIQHIEGIIQGEEKEKNRIAIELHDGIGGKLAGIKHFVSSLAKTEETSVLSNNISAITKEVRLLSHSLSHTYGLQKPLKNLLEELEEQYKNHFSFEITLYPEEEIHTISDEKKLFLYRSIQELVNNTYKYAKANTISISLTSNEDLLLMVEDNGIGFNTEEKPDGIGLNNIKEKLLKYNGDLHIDSSPKTGTTIIIKLPK